MKQAYLIGMSILLCLGISAQESLEHAALVVNIGVEVRVFDKGQFVDGLTLQDFEVLEDGVKQKLEAVYLIKKDLITRKEEKKTKFNPETSRTFFLFFELSQYLPRVGEAVDFFMENILLPNDSLIVVTPVNTYRLKEKGLDIKPREEIAKELKGILKKDAFMGDAEYRSTLKDLEGIASTLSNRLLSPDGEGNSPEKSEKTFQGSGAISTPGIGYLSIEEIVTLYSSYLQKLDTLRKVNEERFYDFAKYLKARDGQKYVFLFYQREFIPQIDSKTLTQVAGAYQNMGGIDLSHLTLDIAEGYKRDVPVDVDRVRKAFADASAVVNFLFITKSPEHVPGVTFTEQSNDIFAPFMEMAKSTGGFHDSSMNPSRLFQDAVEASENYYLLYYAPKNFKTDGKFRTIEVRIKGKNYIVKYRAGYYGN